MSGCSADGPGGVVRAQPRPSGVRSGALLLGQGHTHSLSFNTKAADGDLHGGQSLKAGALGGLRVSLRYF